MQLQKRFFKKLCLYWTCTGFCNIATIYIVLKSICNRLWKLYGRLLINPCTNISDKWLQHLGVEIPIKVLELSVSNDEVNLLENYVAIMDTVVSGPLECNAILKRGSEQRFAAQEKAPWRTRWCHNGSLKDGKGGAALWAGGSSDVKWKGRLQKVVPYILSGMWLKSKSWYHKTLCA